MTQKASCGAMPLQTKVTLLYFADLFILIHVCEHWSGADNPLWDQVAIISAHLERLLLLV